MYAIVGDDVNSDQMITMDGPCDVNAECGDRYVPCIKSVPVSTYMSILRTAFNGHH